MTLARCWTAALVLVLAAGCGTPGTSSAEKGPAQTYFDGVATQTVDSLQHSLDVVYADFTGKVASGRHLDPAKTEQIAQGQIWTGSDARDRGLVDALGGWSVAIELADVSFAPADVEEILAGNIYHRHVLLGPVVPSLPSPLSFTVLRDGVEVAATSQPEALTGELGFVLASMADTLAVCGAGLRAGDVVITGSVVPPIDVAHGGLWEVAAAGLGALNLRVD